MVAGHSSKRDKNKGAAMAIVKGKNLFYSFYLLNRVISNQVSCVNNE